MPEGKTLMEVFGLADQSGSGNDLFADPADLLLRAADAICREADLLKEQIATYALELADRDSRLRTVTENALRLQQENRVLSKERDALLVCVDELTRKLEIQEIAK